MKRKEQIATEVKSITMPIRTLGTGVNIALFQSIAFPRNRMHPYHLDAAVNATRICSNYCFKLSFSEWNSSCKQQSTMQLTEIFFRLKVCEWRKLLTSAKNFPICTDHMNIRLICSSCDSTRVNVILFPGSFVIEPWPDFRELHPMLIKALW